MAYFGFRGKINWKIEIVRSIDIGKIILLIEFVENDQVIAFVKYDRLIDFFEIIWRIDFGKFVRYCYEPIEQEFKTDSADGNAQIRPI